MTKSKSQSNNISLFFYILPTIILFLLILAIPLFNLIKYSLGDSTIIEGFKEWNNFKNFKYLTTSRFLDSLKVTLIYFIFGVAGVVICGTIMALALNKPIKGRAVFRSLAIIPWVVPQAFAAAMWSWVLNPQFGFLNQLLQTLNITDKAISFLSKDNALKTVIVVRIWQGAPFIIISLLSALQTIPNDINEAASLDGVNGIQRFIYITLPFIKPVLITATLIISSWTIQIFDIVYILTGGGPARSTQLIAIEVYQKAFLQDDFGVASAISLVLLMIIILFSLLNIKFENETW